MKRGSAPGGPADAAANGWRPAVWVRALVATAPARWPWARSVRAAVAVTTPLLIAALAGDPGVGLWVAMGALLAASGERPGAYPVRLRKLAASAPLAAAAFLLGALSAFPPVVIVVVMAALAFASAIVSGISATLSAATMQAMLIAALAIGLPQVAPYWPAALLFLSGAALYAVLLAIEMLFARRRPEREALVGVLRALEALARHRAARSPADPADRARVLRALDAYGAVALADRGAAQGPTRDFGRAGGVARAADQLLARLLAHDAVPQLCAQTADRLAVVAVAVAQRRRPPERHAPTLTRLRLLEAAIFGPVSLDVGEARPAHRGFAVGRALYASALRLALCTALGYTAMFVVPIERGYWIPLTIALVMKPDLGSVFARAVLRSVGTVGGAAFAALVGGVTGAPLGAVAVIAVLVLTLPWAIARSYALQALVLTPIIMIMLGMVDPAHEPGALTGPRILTTVLGGAIVIVAGYLPWPSARHVHVADRFDGALRTLAEYADAVASRADASHVATARHAAYARLSDTATALQRLLSEPPPAGTEAFAWLPVVSAAERVADRLTDASASRPEQDVTGAGAALRVLADELAAIAVSSPEATERALPSNAASDAADDVIQELADEIAHLRPMLMRERSRGERRHRKERTPS